MSKFLTKPKFVAWLQKQPKRKLVGMSGSCLDCPLARYAKANGMVQPDVSDGAVWTPVGVAAVLLPQWANRFIERVDGVAEDVIYPEKALAFLGVKPKKKKKKEVKRVAKTKKKKGTGKKGC